MVITKREDVTKQGFCKLPLLWIKIRLRGSLFILVLIQFQSDCHPSGWGRGGRLFEAGRLLTFSAFRMGAYSRWVPIRQRGWVVSASDSQSGRSGFESRSGHLLDLCSVVPTSISRSATLVNRQLVAFCQLGFLILFYSTWIICFQIFEWSACKLAD